MKRVFYPMTNPIQNYAWGSKTAMSELLDIENPTGDYQAELWMGAHPNGCSEVDGMKLSDFIKQDPEAILGTELNKTFGQLPYLFKVLAAEKALSIQVHPNKQQAEIGYLAEEELELNKQSPLRNYRDPNHKPELVYALTSYTALNGFKPASRIVAYFTTCRITSLKHLVDDLHATHDVETFFEALMTIDVDLRRQSLSELFSWCLEDPDKPFQELILSLFKQYKDDLGVFGPLLLNLVTLKPGDAMYLDACTPHAYIKGVALEVMANSDNVLRAGLTTKRVDVKELVSCTDFKPMPEESLLLKSIKHNNLEIFPVPVEDFSFSILHETENKHLKTSSPEIIFVIEGEVHLESKDGEKLSLKKGQSAFIPAYIKEYRVTVTGKAALVF